MNLTKACRKTMEWWCKNCKTFSEENERRTLCMDELARRLAEAERDTIREQLRIAREGLDRIDKASALSPDWSGREIIGDTLARMNAMEARNDQ